MCPLYLEDHESIGFLDRQFILYQFLFTLEYTLNYLFIDYVYIRQGILDTLIPL